MPATPIPFLDLRDLHQPLRSELRASFEQLLESSNFVGGEAVSRFEAAFAGQVGVAHCVGVGNGTDALYLALRALGVGPGDEVITVPNTFVGTVEAITRNGASPVLVDVDPERYLIAPTAVEEAIGPRTRAIIAVHLYGQVAPMEALRDLAARGDLALIEDAAQAHGARLGEATVGSLGTLGCFSFYPSKNLGALGDGGAVVTDREELAGEVRRLANHGRSATDRHVVAGINSRLDALQAAFLEIKLEHLEAWNGARRRLVALYRELLSGVPGVVLPVVPPDTEPVWHLLPVRVPEREALQAALKQQGIETRAHFAVPVHRQPAYAHLGLLENRLPVCEAIAPTLLSLPLYPGLEASSVERIATQIAAVARRRGW